jgi:hypothetical protein
MADAESPLAVRLGAVAALRNLIEEADFDENDEGDDKDENDSRAVRSKDSDTDSDGDNFNDAVCAPRNVAQPIPLSFAQSMSALLVPLVSSALSLLPLVQLADSARAVLDVVNLSVSTLVPFLLGRVAKGQVSAEAGQSTLLSVLRGALTALGSYWGSCAARGLQIMQPLVLTSLCALVQSTRGLSFHALAELLPLITRIIADPTNHDSLLVDVFALLTEVWSVAHRSVFSVGCALGGVGMIVFLRFAGSGFRCWHVASVWQVFRASLSDPRQASPLFLSLLFYRPHRSHWPPLTAITRHPICCDLYGLGVAGSESVREGDCKGANRELTQPPLDVYVLRDGPAHPALKALLQAVTAFAPALDCMFAL